MWATAVGVARIRAFESARENALFDDPLAAAFATAGGFSVQPPPQAEDLSPQEEARRRRWRAVAFSVVIRTRFLDDLLAEAVGSGVRQVVLLGAGMDSRAYRLDWPAGTRLFELDTAEPLDFKESVLRAERARPRCERRTVAVDLREDWPAALAAAGHDPALPTVWIAEGLLIYLPQEAVDLLLDRIGGLSAPGSRMGLTMGSQQTLERFAEDQGTAADMWVSAMPDDPVGWLAGHGWDAGFHTVTERAAAYGRPVAEPSPPRRGPGGLVSARRR
ncbi:class I SAM-dependent methyltransferase [Streptacidiphilus sp. 4-A2]|nr:class I SAM-dependent methyltransferase [Streptacidiphilus sp. 4-A2]